MIDDVKYESRTFVQTIIIIAHQYENNHPELRQYEVDTVLYANFVAVEVNVLLHSSICIQSKMRY